MKKILLVILVTFSFLKTVGAADEKYSSIFFAESQPAYGTPCNQSNGGYVACWMPQFMVAVTIVDGNGKAITNKSNGIGTVVFAPQRYDYNLQELPSKVDYGEYNVRNYDISNNIDYRFQGLSANDPDGRLKLGGVNKLNKLISMYMGFEPFFGDYYIDETDKTGSTPNYTQYFDWFKDYIASGRKSSKDKNGNYQSFVDIFNFYTGIKIETIKKNYIMVEPVYTYLYNVADEECAFDYDSWKCPKKQYQFTGTAREAATNLVARARRNSKQFAASSNFLRGLSLGFIEKMACNIYAPIDLTNNKLPGKNLFSTSCLNDYKQGDTFPTGGSESEKISAYKKRILSLTKIGNVSTQYKIGDVVYDTGRIDENNIYGVGFIKINFDNPTEEYIPITKNVNYYCKFISNSCGNNQSTLSMTLMSTDSNGKAINKSTADCIHANTNYKLSNGKAYCYENVSYDFSSVLGALNNGIHDTGTLLNLPKGKVTGTRICYTTIKNLKISDLKGSIKNNSSGTGTLKNVDLVYNGNTYKYARGSVTYGNMISGSATVRNGGSVYTYTIPFTANYLPATSNNIDLKTTLLTNYTTNSSVLKGREDANYIISSSFTEETGTKSGVLSFPNLELKYSYLKSLQNAAGNKLKSVATKKTKTTNGGVTTNVTTVYNSYVSLDANNNSNSYNCPFNVNLKNELYDENEKCISGCLENPNLNIKFRTIDLDNPFPSRAGIGRSAGANWQAYSYLKEASVNGTMKKTVKYENISDNRGTDDNNPNDLYDLKPLYTIKLDATTIRKIRDYNKSISEGYTDFNLDCYNGTGSRCISKFLDDTKIFANKITGTCANAVNDNLIYTDDDILKFFAVCTMLNECQEATDNLNKKYSQNKSVNDYKNELDFNKDGVVNTADSNNMLRTDDKFNACRSKNWKGDAN